MTVRAICRTSHEPSGAPAGAVIAVFTDMQEAVNRGLEESYPNCEIEYEEDGNE